MDRWTVSCALAGLLFNGGGGSLSPTSKPALIVANAPGTPQEADAARAQRIEYAKYQVEKKREAWKRLYEAFQRAPGDVASWRKDLWMFFEERKFPQDLESWAIAEADAWGTGNPTPIDLEARETWRRQYAEVRAAYFASPEVKPSEIGHVVQSELAGEMLQAGDRKALGESFDVESWIDRALAYEFGYNGMGRLMGIYHYQYRAGFTHEQLARFTKGMTASPNAGIRRRAESRLRLLALRDRPMELRYRAMDGREVDLEKLRGKIVLVNVWPCG